MAYAERHLADDETLLRATRRHWTELFGAFVALLLVWVVAGALLWVLPDRDWRATAAAVVVGAAVLASLWLWLIPLLKWRSTVYVLTSKRIYRRTGFLTKTEHSIPLIRVNDISFEATLRERILRQGTLTIQSASEHGMLTLQHVPDPEGLTAAINQAVAEEEGRQHSGPGGPGPYGR
ncbi:PH domain-containing protein [Streptomyces sp. B1866]|uniref:PH domain-containing protein n=1 Tax=Streptomyces sp. B1866 TaxID=3075431 RepID=UPI00288F0799|nr:PH domain-containing protein [Streptomyces sp. B1866]MDT3396496.1 PH domain-containing protein [Streptomyces sp. B1866]